MKQSQIDYSYTFYTTVELLKFVMVQFPWYSLIDLPLEITSSTKRIFDKVSFLIETGN